MEIDHEQIIKLYNDGLNSSDIATKLGIKRQAVYKHLKMDGLKSHNKKPLKPRKVSEEDINNAITLYNEMYTFSEIVKKLNLNCTASELSLLFKRRNIEVRSRGKRITFNENYFETINDEHKAYWLGFIYADGGIVGNRLRIEIQSQDVEIINNFRNDINGKNKTVICNHGGKDNVAISFSSDKLKSDLEKYGVVQNKTYKLNGIPDIPKFLIRHFIRGYFDGNGTVYMNSKSNSLRFGFYGNKSVTESIRELLHDEIDLSFNGIYEKVGCWLLSYAKKSDINKFYHYIYDDATLYLSRKKSKFENNM